MPWAFVERKRKSGRLWLISVLLLSLPSVVFAALHLLFLPDKLPEFLDLTLAFTGMFGGLTIIAAFGVTVLATFQPRVPEKVKVILWMFVALSILGCLYISQVPI